MADRTQTIYNGSEPCEKCGAPLNPIESLYAYSQKLCPKCRNNTARSLMQNRMTK